jgi:NADH-quinone oxidoreductase subunit G
MTDHTVSLTIDGQEVRVPATYTVYQAAEAAGIHIPTFCNHEKLVPVGACRMCLVEIKGALALQTSCSTPVQEGMVVMVHTSPAAVKARRANIEFLLTNHPLDCPVCDKGGECPLQNQALLDGPGQSRYVEEKRHKNKRYPLSELIVLDQERCVLCWRCIRFLDEWADDHELDLFGRGADTRIDTFPGHPFSSKWQGNTIDLCPVGALTSRAFRFEARVWELENTPSVCTLCAAGCNLVLGIKNNELRRITPRENPDINDTWMCDKGRFAHSFVDHPDRLHTPLIRRDGQLQPATWDEALDVIARRFQAIIQEYGSQAIAGLGSTRVTNEANYLFQRFMRTVAGTNSVDHLGRVPVSATPLVSLPSLEQKDVILLLGCDVSSETPMIELWIKRAILQQGAQVVVANPWQVELGRYGGPWLGYRPGSEVTLVLGLVRAILDLGLQSPASRTTNLDDLRTWLKPYDAAQVEHNTGVPSAALRQAAEMLARAERPAILYGPRWTWHSGGEANLDALANLALLLGGIETYLVAKDNNSLGALEMGVVPNFYPGRLPFKDSAARSRLSGLWGARLSPVEGLDYDGMMAAARTGSLKALWIMGADPAQDCRTDSEALRSIPFLVVQDLFMTGTASLAEVVLPAASFAEGEGSFTNLTGRLQAIRPALRPPGQAQADWWIIVQMALRMADSKRQRSWAFSEPADVLSEMAKALPGYRGLTYARMGKQGWQSPVPQTAPRRTFVRVEPAAADASRSGQVAAPPGPDPALTLVPRHLLYDRGTLLQCSERIQSLVPDPYVMIHPSDATKLNLADGDDVSLVSLQGRLEFAVKVSSEVVPGVALVPLNLGDAPVSSLLAERRALQRVRLVK